MAGIWALLDGVILFLFGMTLMGEHLRSLGGGRTERLLRRAAAEKRSGALLGCVVTAAVQSSSAVTVLAVSLADAGILTLRQTVPVLIGSNVGTTITAWLTGLRAGAADGSGDGGAAVTVLLAGGGLLAYLLLPGRRALGGLALGLFLLLTGMERMTAAAAPLAELEPVRRLVGGTTWSSLAAGAAVTGVLQSSSAAIGLLQAFSATGGVTWGAGVPLVLGGNIGTCATVLLASLGGGRNAKRAALAHLKFNLAGTALLLPVWLVLGAPLRQRAIQPLEIAAVHTGFNLLAAALLLPLSDRLAGREAKRA